MPYTPYLAFRTRTLRQRGLLHVDEYAVISSLRAPVSLLFFVAVSLSYVAASPFYVGIFLSVSCLSSVSVSSLCIYVSLCLRPVLSFSRGLSLSPSLSPPLSPRPPINLTLSSVCKKVRRISGSSRMQLTLQSDSPITSRRFGLGVNHQCLHGR